MREEMSPDIYFGKNNPSAPGMFRDKKNNVISRFAVYYQVNECQLHEE